jgi:hypothetical protein
VVAGVFAIQHPNVCNRRVLARALIGLICLLSSGCEVLIERDRPEPSPSCIGGTLTGGADPRYSPMLCLIYPVSGSVLSGTVNVRIQASSPDGIKHVELQSMSTFDQVEQTSTAIRFDSVQEAGNQSSFTASYPVDTTQFTNGIGAIGYSALGTNGVGAASNSSGFFSIRN